MRPHPCRASLSRSDHVNVYDKRTGPLHHAKAAILVNHDRKKIGLLLLGHALVLLAVNGDQYRTTMDMRGLSVVVQ
jgi:hypothetical protein